MLKPDSTRYSPVVQTRLSGPEWIEPDSSDADSSESGTDSSDGSSRSQPDLPSDLALDLRLREILQQARLATAASGAVIALAYGDKMVCRAALGDKAPSAGVRLNTHSGLSGACVQTREMQLCDDTLVDLRVNAIACRDLGIRSIVVLPVLDGGELWGVLEVFSSASHAFNESDLQALQSLSRKVSQTVHEAIAGGSTLGLAASFSQSPATDEVPPDAIEDEASPDSGQPDTEIIRKDYRTGALTAAVLALAVLLGWMVGRVGWSMAVNRSPIQFPVTPEDAEGTSPVTNAQPAAPGAEATAVAKPVAPPAAPPAVTKPAPKPKTETAEPMGGLVVYEHGKVVFRMVPAPPESPSTVEPGVVGSGAIQKAAIREDEKNVTPAPDSDPTNGYLLQRVEPEYPEAARQQHIQGPVVLAVLVGANGSVRELTVVSGDPQLAKAATDAVRQWRFKPHQLKGQAVEFETRITVNFALPE